MAGIKVFDVSNGSLARTIPWNAAEHGSIIALDSRIGFADASDENRVEIYDIEGNPLRDLHSHGTADGWQAVAAHDGSRLVLHRRGPHGYEFFEWPVAGVTPTVYHIEAPSGLDILDASIEAKLAIGTNRAGEFYTYSLLGGKELSRFSLPIDGDIIIARLSPNGRLAVINTLVVDTQIGTTLGKLSNGERILSAAFSADGSRFAIDFGGTPEVWSTKELKRLVRLERQSNAENGVWFTKIAFSRDGRAIVGGDNIAVWDASSGKLIRDLERGMAATHPNQSALGISNDGTVAAEALVQRGISSGDVGSERQVRVWDVAKGKHLFTLTGHREHVRVILFTPENRWIITASWDGMIRYWDRNNGHLIATFAVTPDGRWVIITDKGLFAATANAGDLLSVVRGFEATSIEQMWQSLYAPDLVREYLAGDTNGDVEDAAAHADLPKILDSGPVPSVAIVRPAPGTSSATDLVDVEVRITDKGKGIGRIEWRINGVTTAVAAGPSGNGPDHTMSRQLALDPGENVIEVVAYNAANLLASPPARATIRLDGVTDGAKPKLHVLAIGINAYIDKGWTPPGKTALLKFPPLNLAVKDATALAVALKQAGVGQYSEIKVTLALDHDATLAGLEKIIDRMAADINPRDTLVLFAAAHGTSLNGRFYMIPQDYDGGNNPAALQARAVGQDRLQEWIANRIKAKRAIVLLDTCESGALVGGYARSRTDVPASEAAIGRLHEATGRPVLTAAAEGKPAFEGYQGHGVFTWALLDALKNGERNANGTIELSELVAHVQDQVPKIAAKLNGRGSTTVAARGSAGERQSARFGSRGEDFAVVRRLP